MKSFWAKITPINMDAYPDQGLPAPQPPKPPSPGAPDQTLPGDLPRPEHPIYFPLPPDVPVDPGYGVPEGAYPDQGLPGEQPRPDQGLPGEQPKPEHPIVLPPGSGGWVPPIYIWGPNDPRPTHPIVIPPDVPPTPETPAIKWKAIWTEKTGWIVIGLPQGPFPTPSKKK